MTDYTGIVEIHGRDYQTVAYRVKQMRAERPWWGIETEILSIDDTSVVVKAQIKDEYNRVIGTGHAEEMRGRGINATSALENCETSAIGRCLAACGWLGVEFASQNEIEQANRKLHETYQHLVGCSDALGLYCYMQGLTEEQKTEAHNSWSAGTKTAQKKAASDLEQLGFKVFSALKDGIDKEDYGQIQENLEDISEAAKVYVWQMFDRPQRSVIKMAMEAMNENNA